MRGNGSNGASKVGKQTDFEERRDANCIALEEGASGVVVDLSCMMCRRRGGSEGDERGHVSHGSLAEEEQGRGRAPAAPRRPTSGGGGGVRKMGE
jgi:hypothetical protein